MSEPVTALNGASFSGAIDVVDAGPIGMITLRGDLSDAALKDACQSDGLVMPGKGKATGGLEAGLLWMSPDEVMLLCAHDAAPDRVAGLARALEGHHSLVAEVSDARAVFRLTGEGAAIREVLAKLSPADMRISALPVGRVRRTRLAQVPAAFWFTDDSEAVVICFRSVADYVFGLLSTAAQPGSEVGHF